MITNYKYIYIMHEYIKSKFERITGLRPDSVEYHPNCHIIKWHLPAQGAYLRFMLIWLSVNLACQDRVNVFSFEDGTVILYQD